MRDLAGKRFSLSFENLALALVDCHVVETKIGFLY
jgi:hypothetical protein